MVILINKNHVTSLKILSFDASKSHTSSRSTWKTQVIKYWTPDKMRAAKPIESLTKNAALFSSRKKTSLSKLPNSDGPLTIIEPVLPDNFIVENRQANPTKRATTTVGKVFFTTNKGDARCSASVVSAESNSLVATAAHCLYDHLASTWYTNWVFVPAYDNGDMPFDMWLGNYLYIAEEYTSLSSSSEPNFNFDVGFVVVNTVASKKLAQVTGSLGIVFNAARNQLTYSFGYPVNIANGESLSYCVSKTVPQTCDVNSDYAGQALRCNMQQGCSGGPWILNFDTSNGTGYINSVNSFNCQTSLNMMHGPYFDSNIKFLYDSVKTKI